MTDYIIFWTIVSIALLIVAAVAFRKLLEHLKDIADAIRSKK